MLKLAAAFAIAVFVATPAFADEKPSDDEAKTISEALNAMGCTEYEEVEKEKRSDGGYHFEIDDAKCDDGEYDIKLDQNFKLITKDRE